MNEQSTKCVSCGHFLSHKEMTDGSAIFEHEPLSEFGPEKTEWLCAKCADKEGGAL